MSNVGIGNLNFVTFQVHRHGRLIREWTQHNAVEAALLGHEVFYLARATATKPVDNIRFEYTDDGEVPYVARVATVITESTVDPWVTTWQSSWENETGGVVTVNTNSLVHYASDTGEEIVFATSEPAQELEPGDIMTVNWTHTWTINVADEGIQEIVLTQMQGYFEGVYDATAPFYQVIADDGDEYNLAADLTVISGGSTLDTQVVFTSGLTNGKGADTTIVEVKCYMQLPDPIPTAAFVKSGLTQEWLKDATVNGRLTITAAETVAP